MLADAIGCDLHSVKALLEAAIRAGLVKVACEATDRRRNVYSLGDGVPVMLRDADDEPAPIRWAGGLGVAAPAAKPVGAPHVGPRLRGDDSEGERAPDLPARRPRAGGDQDPVSPPSPPTAAASIDPPHPRFALWSDGRLEIRADGQLLILATAATQALLHYLNQVAQQPETPA